MIVLLLQKQHLHLHYITAQVALARYFFFFIEIQTSNIWDFSLEVTRHYNCHNYYTHENQTTNRVNKMIVSLLQMFLSVYIATVTFPICDQNNSIICILL